ncbi:MAG: class I SAM-dependent methyltransferase [Planctomycetaceae bacterium]|nr:class I SAM-dependent methyltransferase [Planctomycetaceae bacterium]
MLEHRTECHVCGGESLIAMPEMVRLVRPAFSDTTILRCRRCGLGQLAPLPSEADVRGVYESAAYAGAYDQAGEQFVVNPRDAARTLQPRFEMLQRLLAHGEKILDVGASRGHFLAEARDRGWKIAGLEAGQNAIDFARSELGIEIQAGTIETAALPEGEFDCVHLSHVLEHLRDPRGAVQRIRQLLRPGGVFVVEVPNEFGDLFTRCRQWFLRRPPTANVVPSTHLYFFTLRSLRQLLTDAGFEVLQSATPRRNQSYESRIPLGTLAKRAVYGVEQRLQMGPNLEMFARRVGS